MYRRAEIHHCHSNREALDSHHLCALPSMNNMVVGSYAIPRSRDCPLVNLVNPVNLVTLRMGCSSVDAILAVADAGTYLLIIIMHQIWFLGRDTNRLLSLKGDDLSTSSSLQNKDIARLLAWQLIVTLFQSLSSNNLIGSLTSTCIFATIMDVIYY